MSISPPHSVDPHFSWVASEILSGRVIPFLGAGVNLCDLPAEDIFQLGTRLPSGTELARYLRQRFASIPSGETDLARVCQCYILLDSPGGLYDALHDIFKLDYEPTTAHIMLASIPARLRALKRELDFPLIITTNYDDVMERALRRAGEEFDVVRYVATGDHRGKFIHTDTCGSSTVIERPNEYRSISFAERPILLKIHGTVDRSAPGSNNDSYVASEDDYIDYLTRTDVCNLIPVTILAKMRQSRFLFFGYGLRDWNLRVILHRVWGEQTLERKSWAIQHPVDNIDQKIWDKRNVSVIDYDLNSYVKALCELLNQSS
jgi:hypothetical protein